MMTLLLAWTTLPMVGGLSLAATTTRRFSKQRMARHQQHPRGSGAAFHCFAASSNSDTTGNIVNKNDHASNDDDDSEDNRSGLLSAMNAFVNIAAALLLVPPNAIQPFGPSVTMEPHPPRTSRERLHRQQVSQLLELGYGSTSTSTMTTKDDTMLFTLPESEETSLFGKWHKEVTDGPNPSTYGEVTTLGARQLFHYMGMTTASTTSTPTAMDSRDNNNDDNDGIIFWDLGMGRGKLVVQAYLELPFCSKSCGVELSQLRYQHALGAWQRILHEHPYLEQQPLQQTSGSTSLSSSTEHNNIDKKPALSLYEGDLFQQDLTTATHIYVASLCFTNTMMQDLNHKLAKLFSLKCVATLKELPFWKYSRTEYVEMSWTKPFGCQVYFYDIVCD